MPVSPEEVKAFIADAKKARQSWLTWAERSWSEIKKTQRNGKLYTVSPNSTKKRAKYPAWYGIFKIRQPLLLSRTGIPICKDTTQDGGDNVGASAAFFKERLAINLSKSFDFFDALCTARDDFLVTNFGILRAFYKRDEIKERVKEYIQPQQDPLTGDVAFVDSAGKVVLSDDIKQDDDGFFVETDRVVDVENECICLDQTLYKHAYIDPEIYRFNKCERMAFELHFSAPQFKETFGGKAYAKLPKPDDTKDAVDEAAPKRQTIKVYEYWDRYERKVYWLPELADEFVTPLKVAVPEEFEEQEETNGLYDLERFFPVPDPIVSNQATDEFWPTPEFYQLTELIEDIHTLFSRMLAVTKAIRARALFDNNVEGLQEALAEATEGDAFGVPNLAQSLINNGGSLAAVVQYVPVKEMVDALQQLYAALEQRLNTLYRLTGVSDLLQGLIADGTQRTFGERQMLEKYALNQHAEPQRKMQEFVRDCYELLCEMALKNFKDESLARYMLPQTAPPVHRQNFQAALGLLKNDRKRFRIDLETDSTVALNEQYDKQMRVELVNALTTAIEKVAGIAASSPALVAVELHALKFMIQGFRQGKVFQQEVTESIDNVIKQLEAQAAQEPPPNPAQIQLQIEQERLKIDAVRAQTEQQKAAAEAQLREYQILADERIKTAQLQLDSQMQAFSAQMEQIKTQNEQTNKQVQNAAVYEKLRNEIAATQAELGLKRDELMLEVQRLADDRNADAYATAAKERIGMFEAQIKQAAQQMEEYRTYLDMQERYATEARLQQEAQLNQMLKQVEIVSKQAETQHNAILAAAEARAIAAPPPPKSKKKISVQRDELGNVAGYSIEGGDGYQVVRDANGDIVGYEPIGGL